MPRNTKRVASAASVAEDADPILRALMSLSEEELTAKIVVPFIELVHPGRIEYTHSSDEAGRDIVSFGRDVLGRPHVLCVQVKARAVSHGARAFGEVFNVSTSAKLQGVTREEGTICIPNEVWYLTSYPFPEWKRRQVSALLQQMDAKNVKFIPGGEFAVLVREKLPEIASALVAHTHPNLVAFVSALSRHHEGRAFGLTFDRQLEEFYVTAAISSATALVKDAIAGGVKLSDLREIKEIPLLRLVHLDELHRPLRDLRQLVKTRLPLHASKLNFTRIVPDIQVDSGSISGEAINAIEEAYTALGGMRPRRPSKTNSRESPSDEKLQRLLGQTLLSVEFTHKTNAAFRALVRSTRALIASCPPVLVENSPAVRNAVVGVRELDEVVRQATTMKLVGNSPAVRNAVVGARELDEVVRQATTMKLAPPGLPRDTGSERVEIIRVKVPQPERLLDLFRVLVIDGPAGCGKTTLLKTLAMRLAGLGRKVAYLSCAELTPEARKCSLVELMNRFGRSPDGPSNVQSETVLVVDGLDEAAFDVSPHIEEAQGVFANIVVSCRTAYSTNLRSVFPAIGLSPFTDSERAEFFEKWFRMKPDLVKRAAGLVAEYPDLNLHTRLPLIATILVALLENGIEPKTRSDIYSMRLDLLLSRWDKSRGVRRFEVDKPEAKRRFLRQVAYKMHSQPKRTRLITLEDLQAAYESSLGRWGYDQKFQDVLHDLVISSGVLAEERADVFSLGHLTFQEHLAGEYLASLMSG